MSLKDLLRVAYGPTELIPLLSEFILKREKDSRDDGWHPSEFCGMCARRSLFESMATGEKLDAKKAMEQPDTKRERIFDVGKALHAWYQNEYFGKMGILWGRWRSMVSDKIHWGFLPHGGRWEYREVPVKASVEGCTKPIVGHSDGVLKIRSEYRLLEIKTINDYGFSKLSEAQPGHVAQAQVYAELIRQGLVPGIPKESSEVTMLSSIVILYINKDTSAEREFIVPLDSARALQILKQPRLYEVGLRDRCIPSREECSPECDNLLRPKVQQCSTREKCFNPKNCFSTEEIATWKIA